MREGFVQAGAARLQTFEEGSGPEIIVFVHGFTKSGRIWRLTQQALDPTRFRSIAISNRGAGDSDHGTQESDYTVESFAAYLFQAVEALGLRDFTLVGHSMGGLTVTQYALDHQDTLKALVLLDPAPMDGRTRVPGARNDNEARDYANAPADFVVALQADVDRNPPERIRGSQASMQGIRLRERLGELRIPVLMVGGDQDTLVGVQNILTDYLALPAERRSLEMFHRVGHSPNVAVPERVAAVIQTFVLETVPGLLAAPA